MNCLQYQNQMEEKLDGQLSPEQDSVLKSHVETCPVCAKTWQETEGVWNLLKSAKPISPSTGFVARTVRRATSAEAPTAGLAGWAFWPVRRLQLAVASCAMAFLILAGCLWLMHLPGDSSAPSGTELADSNHELLDNLSVVADLDLLQDYEVIEQLDTLAETHEGSL